MRFPPILLYKWLPKSTMVTGLGSSLAKGGRGEGPKAWGGGGRMLKPVGRVEVLWGSKGSIHSPPLIPALPGRPGAPTPEKQQR